MIWVGRFEFIVGEGERRHGTYFLLYQVDRLKRPNVSLSGRWARSSTGKLTGNGVDVASQWLIPAPASAFASMVPSGWLPSFPLWLPPRSVVSPWLRVCPNRTPFSFWATSEAIPFDVLPQLPMPNKLLNFVPKGVTLLSGVTDRPMVLIMLTVVGVGGRRFLSRRGKCFSTESLL